VLDDMLVEQDNRAREAPMMRGEGSNNRSGERGSAMIITVLVMV